MARKTRETEAPRCLPVVLVMHGGGSVHGELLDISGRNATIRSTRKVAPGDCCGLVALMPFAPAMGLSRYFEASGRVRQATRSGRATLIALEMFDVKGDLQQCCEWIAGATLNRRSEHVGLHAVRS